MKKTIRQVFRGDAYVKLPCLGGEYQQPLHEFRGKTVDITVETVEEKPKVQMCEAHCGCKKSAQWKVTVEGSGASALPWYCCDEHISLVRLARRTYTITPILPQPPAPVVVEGICDNRPDFCMQGAKGTPWYEFPVPPGLTGKRFKYRLEEIP